MSHLRGSHLCEVSHGRQTRRRVSSVRDVLRHAKRRMTDLLWGIFFAVLFEQELCLVVLRYLRIRLLAWWG